MNGNVTISIWNGVKNSLAVIGFLAVINYIAQVRIALADKKEQDKVWKESIS